MIQWYRIRYRRQATDSYVDKIDCCVHEKDGFEFFSCEPIDDEMNQFMESLFL